MDGDPLDLNRIDRRGRTFLTDHAPADCRVQLAPPSDVLAVVAARLRTALSVLPDDAERIALYLAARGLKGEQCNAGTDPLAQYLTRSCGHDVFNDARTCTAEGVGWSFTMELPDHVRAFVLGFDANEWPYLVAGHESCAAEVVDLVRRIDVAGARYADRAFAPYNVPAQECDPGGH
jgi:hypothetical protein